jgi:hydrogenase nickel incorporation protein HypA/HybF
VAAVNLVVGDYSGLVADSIALYFDIIAENTACEGAALNIERVAPMLRCKDCGGLFERRPFAFDCPEVGCSGEGEPTEIGREFYIRSIEIEDMS